MQFLLFLVLSFTMSACFGSANGSDFRFDWGNSKVLVTEAVTKESGTIEVQYVLTSKRQEAGVIISQSDLKILSVDSQKPDSSLINVLKASFSIPKMKIDSKGNLEEVIDFDLYINRLANSVPDPNYGKTIKTEPIKNMLLNKSVENWCYWVCSWIGLDMSSGRPHIEKTTIEFNGYKFPQLLEYNFVPNYEKSERTLVRLNSYIGGDQATKSIEESSKNIISQYNNPEKFDGNKGVVDNIQKYGVVTAIVDPASLKPHSVEVESTTMLASASGSKEKYEKKVFVFKWQ